MNEESWLDFPGFSRWAQWKPKGSYKRGPLWSQNQWLEQWGHDPLDAGRGEEENVPRASRRNYSCWRLDFSSLNLVEGFWLQNYRNICLCCFKPLSLGHWLWQQLSTNTKRVSKINKSRGLYRRDKKRGKFIHEKTSTAPTAVLCRGKASFLQVKQKQAQNHVLCWMVIWPLQVIILNLWILVSANLKWEWPWQWGGLLRRKQESRVLAHLASSE